MALWASCLPTAIVIPCIQRRRLNPHREHFKSRMPSSTCCLDSYAFDRKTQGIILTQASCRSMTMSYAGASIFPCELCRWKSPRCSKARSHSSGFASFPMYLHRLSSVHSRYSGKGRVVSDKAEEILASKFSVLLEDTEVENNKVEYNWEEEWYPLYLTRELPRDAPLGLTVFDKQLVLHCDGNGIIRCYDDCCPHRLAKLSEGQVIDGRLECLYHGWQFEGDGQCAKIPQLPTGAKIPKAACVRSYIVQESQGVIWVWMADKSLADFKKIPYFEHFNDPNIREFSAIHVLPYNHSILLENVMDPAHVPISHDRTDFSAKRENAQALNFEIIERTSRGFAGRWGQSSSDSVSNISRFEAPCVYQNEKVLVDKDGNKQTFIAVMLCTPTGQGKSMLIARFGSVSKRAKFSPIPKWLVHQISNKILEQDMGFLASQNEIILQKGVPTGNLYLNLRSSDVFVIEYRKWLDRVGHGMPYYVGHKTHLSPPKEAVLMEAPAGFMAASASSQPVKGALGMVFAADPNNRYFRHVVHCADCRGALRTFKILKKVSYILAGISAGLGIFISRTPLKIALVVIAALAIAASYSCQLGVNFLTTNELRPHRR